jgi:hypothetical protein
VATNTCKICGKTFTERGLHGHIIKAHNIAVPAYYEQHVPRYDRLTGEKFVFGDYFTYTSADFVSRKNERDWLKQAKAEDAKTYLLKCLRARMDLKKLAFAPSYVEFETSELPPYKAYVYFFGSYSAACKELGVEPLLRDRKEVPPLASKNVEIFIDTREQRPLKFKNARKQKLAFGDYTLSGDDYTYTYVDRKSDSDFKSTVTLNQERFIKELDRAVAMDSYVYVVVEESIAQIELLNKMAAHTVSMNYVWSSMRKIQHIHPRRTQFVFTGSRENSEKIIPYLLRYGKELWDTDVQYLLHTKGIV